jgi:uncharacterized protein
MTQGTKLKMLLAFRVANFKSIREVQTVSMTGTSLTGPHEPKPVEFAGGENGILPCAIIYGANASGKSNILSALSRMRKIVLNSQADAIVGKKLKFTPFLLGGGSEGNPTLLEVSFVRGSVRYDYGFEYDSERIAAEWLFAYPEGRRRKLFERRGLEMEFGASLRGVKKVLTSLLKEEALFLSLSLQDENSELRDVGEFFREVSIIEEISVPSPQINAVLTHGDLDARSIDFLEALGTGVCTYKIESKETDDEQLGLLGAVFKAIASQQNKEFTGSELELFKKQNEIQLGHRSNSDEVVYFTVDLESAGTRRLLLVLNSVFTALDRGTVMVIDEIDASLHTRAVESLIRLFLDPSLNRKGAQLVASTHDTNMLGSEILRRDEVWFSSKSSNGASIYYSLAEVQVRKDELFEKSYLSGRYGAIPPRPFLRSFERERKV